jgi:hypothetical protein
VEREVLAAQIEETKRQIEGFRQMVASGAAMPQDMAKLQEQLRLLDIKRGSLDQKVELAVRDVELKKQQARQVQELLRRKDDLADVRRSKAAEVEQTLTKSAREYERLQAEYVTMLQEKERLRLDAAQVSPEVAKALEAKLERVRALLEERDKEIADLRTALLSQRAAQSQQISEQVQRLVDEASLRATRMADEAAARHLEINAAAEQARTAVRTREARLREATAVIAENDTARAGDIVHVELHNEPDLPQTYVVQNDGTIRLPLIGSVKVIGLTPRQVQDAVRKPFSDRRLESGANAVVSVRRGRTSRDGAR